MTTSIVKRSRTALSCFLLLLIATAASADGVDTYLRAEMANQRIPGVAVAVLRDGKPISVRTLGVANIELNTPVTRDTVFKIGSVSKQFIATGIMLLVRDGRVRLDEPVKTYLDDVPAAWSGITLRHLLTHTSGLVRESPAFDGLKVPSDAWRRERGLSLPDGWLCRWRRSGDHDERGSGRRDHERGHALDSGRV
jgi:CubicO group peptidase (beta-lactamase class C family)